MNRRETLYSLAMAVGAATTGTIAAAADAATAVAAPPGAAARSGAAPAATGTGSERPPKTASVAGCVALVTGSNSGIGLGFVQVLLARGARKVYATARRPETFAALTALDPKRVVVIPLDVTVDAQRRAAAESARDVTWLINNAGIAGSDDVKERRFLTATTLDDGRNVMETNFWAQAEMVRLFTPIILANRGGAIVQILSVGALYSVPTVGTYSASKFAARAMIAAVRAELDQKPILAAGVFTGGVITRMSRPGDTFGVTPEVHANQVIDALARGDSDIFAGAGSREAYEELRADPKAFERKNIDRWFGPTATVT